MFAGRSAGHCGAEGTANAGGIPLEKSGEHNLKYLIFIVKNTYEKYELLCCPLFSFICSCRSGIASDKCRKVKYRRLGASTPPGSDHLTLYVQLDPDGLDQSGKTGTTGSGRCEFDSPQMHSLVCFFREFSDVRGWKRENVGTKNVFFFFAREPLHCGSADSHDSMRHTKLSGV